MIDGSVFKLVIFAAMSGGLIALSWKSFRVPASHGFFRFFAFESILALILINIHAWFVDAFSVRQIISWALLFTSLILLVAGVRRLHASGNPEGKRMDDTLLAFEKTTALVTSGIYGYIRHPLYGSLLFLSWGTFLKDLTGYSMALVMLATLFLIATARADEAECIAYFGQSYREYMKKTKMFIPLLF